MASVYLALVEMSALLAAAEALSSALRRYGVPSLVSQMLVGVLFAPTALGGLVNSLVHAEVFSANVYVDFVAELSVILLIFVIGIESGLRAVRSAGPYSALGAVFGAVVPALAVAAASGPFVGARAAPIMGAAMAATSLAAVSSVMLELRVPERPGYFMTFAGAFDDVVAMVIVSAAAAVALGGPRGLGALAALAARYLAAWAIIMAVSLVVVPRLLGRIGGYAVPVSLLALFVIVASSVSLGLSPIVGSYVAGVAVGESAASAEIRRAVEGLLEVFGPLFFIAAGLMVDVRGLASLGELALVAVLVAAAVAGKVAGIMPFAAAYLRDARESAVVSLGMVPRGEVGLAIALAGLDYGLLTPADYGALVLSVIIVTVVGAVAFRAAGERAWGRAPRGA